MGSDDWMTTADVATELGVGTEWVRRRIAAGALRARAYLVGSRHTYRIERVDLDAFLADYSGDTSRDPYLPGDAADQ